MSILSDLFKNKTIGYNPYNPISIGGFGLVPKKQSLPNNSGTINTVTTVPTPVVPPIQTPTPPPVNSPAKKPIFSANTQTPTTSTIDMSADINPATGKLYSPQEYADMMASRARGGMVPTYAGDILTNPNQTAEQLTGRAYDLNNARNDIATGTTDPYKVASQSGVQYTPAQLKAIENAYAGIYDPALKDVFAKIDAKEKEVADEKAWAQELKKMAVQHQYAMEEKQASNYSGLTGLGTGGYIPGENPAVDAWAQRIYDQQAKITDIPASQKGMRDAVVLALQSSGNQLNGKPTTTELGKAALVNAKALMNKLNESKGTTAVGASRLWGAGGLRALVPGTPAFGFANDFNAIKAQLSLDAVKYLKGQGQVSDAERALLAQAATKLNLSQSETEFKNTLQEIINKLENGNIEITPQGESSQPQTMILNGQVLTLQADGTYE